MWRQLVGFGLFGAVIAALGATLSVSRGGGSIGGPDIWMAWGTGYTAAFPLDPTDSIIVAAGVGAVAGALVAGVLWAVGVRLAERSGLRLGRVVGAGLIGVVVGLAPAIILLANAFAGDTGAEYPVLLVYAISGVFGYVLVLAGIFGVLRLSGDAHARATVRTTAVALPIGAVLATGAGVGVAGWFGYTTTSPTWIATILVVTMVLAATFAVARTVAMRRRAEPVVP
ncbi:hypothetical protein CYJ73_07275 [Gordonia terrae]|uniref:Uncharacterized protein n=1 Tax=Gordonia terrae TaxID=2055 RepID=A0A2I1R9X4_9ACTN|nr:hypothetical protein [Gordonia terrae]PKZ65951.1 hypothetical protein CYJ73_07275 [Gordonia terrae]